MNATKSKQSLAWPIGIVVGLGFVVVANGIMIYIALSNPPAPAAKDHWVAAQGWNDELVLREHSAALGWSVATIERSTRNSGVIVHLVDQQGTPLQGLRGTAALSRADTAAFDAESTLVDLGEGRYLAELDAMPAGLVWLDLDVSDAAGLRFVTRESVQFESQESGA